MLLLSGLGMRGRWGDLLGGTKGVLTPMERAGLAHPGVLLWVVSSCNEPMAGFLASLLVQAHFLSCKHDPRGFLEPSCVLFFWWRHLSFKLYCACGRCLCFHVLTSFFVWHVCWPVLLLSPPAGFSDSSQVYRSIALLFVPKYVSLDQLGNADVFCFCFCQKTFGGACSTKWFHMSCFQKFWDFLQTLIL